jgi:GntR family transcriptional regulator/MocR family aminotransferase
MHVVYAERRAVLVRALERELGAAARISGDRAGMHLVVTLPPGADDRAIAVRAAAAGISVIPLSSCYAGRPREPGLVLGYGGARVAEIPDAVRRLGAAIAGR